MPHIAIYPLSREYDLVDALAEQIVRELEAIDFQHPDITVGLHSFRRLPYVRSIYREDLKLELIFDRWQGDIEDSNPHYRNPCGLSTIHLPDHRVELASDRHYFQMDVRRPQGGLVTSYYPDPANTMSLRSLYRVAHLPSAISLQTALEYIANTLTMALYHPILAHREPPQKM